MEGDSGGNDFKSPRFPTVALLPGVCFILPSTKVDGSTVHTDTLYSLHRRLCHLCQALCSPIVSQLPIGLHRHGMSSPCTTPELTPSPVPLLPPTRIHTPCVHLTTMPCSLCRPLNLTSVHPDAIWSLAWTPLNHLISASADGHLRIFDPSELSAPIHDLDTHPLAITSLSVSGDGKRALASSLDGSVVMIDPSEGREVGRVETGREKVAPGENGMLRSVLRER